MGGYKDPAQAEAESPYAGPAASPTGAQADYGNVVGNRNRAETGGAPIGNSQQGYEELVQQQQQQEQQRQQQEQQQQERQNQSIQAAQMMDRLRAMGFTGVPTGQSVYEHQMGIAPVQERTFLENLENRPRYTPESRLGDTETQRRAAAGENVGQVLESQRKYAESTPGTRDDQFYLNEIAKWNANAIERSSEYHHETLATGVQQKANPYENRGDVALAFEKGGNLKDFQPDRYGFNQNVQEEINRLPGGMGLQETAWGVAKSGQAANVDFRGAIDYQIAQEGRYGPYGSLYGGVVDKPVESGGTPPSNGPIGNARLAWGGNVQNQQQTPTGKEWNPFVASAAEPIGFISEGMQFGNTTQKPTLVNPVKPDGTFMGNALAGQFTPAQQEAINPITKISQTISGGVNFAFSIPVGVASLLTFGAIPQWNPKDLEVVVPSKDPIKETIIYGETTHMISGGNQTITNLGIQIGRDKEKISAYDADINTLLQGKVVEGKYAGTAEGFAVVSGKIAARNELAGTVTKNVDTYNAMAKENPIIDTTTTQQTTLVSGTPDKVYQFGYWQMASEEFGNKAMGALGYNRQQLEAYGTTLKSKPGVGGEAERFVYNVMKPTIESPMNLPVYYLEGKMLAGAVGGAGETVTQYGQQGTGKLATVAKVITTTGEGGLAGSAARGLTKWGLPAMFVAGTGYEVTNKGTDFSKETVVTNLESGVMPMALMTYGAMGPEPIRAGYEYGKVRFQEKPMVRQTLETELNYEQRPDVMVQSGIGGSVQYTQTTTIATQPSFLGVSFPRIFSPIERGKPITTTVDLGYGDTGKLIGDRLPGTSSNPLVGTRKVSTVMDTYRGDYVQTGPYQYERMGVAQATGNLKTAEVRLPRTFEEYLKMGAEDAKLTGQNFDQPVQKTISDFRRTLDNENIPGNIKNDYTTYLNRDIQNSAQTEPSSININRALREQTPVIDYIVHPVRTVKSIIKGKSLDTGIKAYGEDVGGIELYRGLGGARSIAGKNIGDIYIDQGIQSWAVEPTSALPYAAGDKVLLRYTPSKGTRGFINPEELEVTLASGKYKITDISEYIPPERYEVMRGTKVYDITDIENIPVQRNARLSPEEMTAQLMADAAKVTEPTKGYRELSATVPAGTPIEKVFDWNVAKQGGTEVEFNKIELEDYFGTMKVQQTGGGESDYSVVVTRDVGEQGFLKGGSYDVTGSQVPEAKIVSQLQEVSRNLKSGSPEEAYAFDNRGNLIYRETGGIGYVNREGVWDAIGNIEGTGSAAHTHPPYKHKITQPLELIDEFIFQQRGKGKYPSNQDMRIYADNELVFNDPTSISADYIISKKGVSIFRRPKEGWGKWNDIEYGTTEYIDDYTSTIKNKIVNEGGMQFVGKNQPYKAKAISERIPDVTAEMQSAYPQGIRTQIVDMVDRMALKDPNLEFVREGAMPKEKSLSQSGSNLGRGGTGGSVSSVTTGGNLMSQQIQTPQETVRMTAQPQMFKSPENIRSSPPSAMPKQISEPVMVFGQSQVPWSKQTPASKQSQKLEPRFIIEPVTSFAQPQMQVPRQNQGQEYSQILKIGSGFKLAQTPEQTTSPVLTQGVWQTPLQGQKQTPIQEQGQIQRQQQITRIQPPPQLTQQIYERPPPTPDVGLPGLPFLPNLPYGGGGYGTKRKGRRFRELFPVGLDIQVYNWNKQRKPHAKAKKGRLIPAKRSKK